MLLRRTLTAHLLATVELLVLLQALPQLLRSLQLFPATMASVILDLLQLV